MSIEQFEEMSKMDPELTALLQRIRTGQTSPEDANLLHEKFHQDTMVPTMRNKAAYQDHLESYGNAGIHTHIDLNDFGQVNKTHGEHVGDEAIKQFGALMSPIAQKYGGRAFHQGGDEFKGWFLEPEHAHRFARDLHQAMDKWSETNKFGGTHRMAASIGIGYNREHAEKSLQAAKDRLGPKDIYGHRQNKHAIGEAPTEAHSLLHETPPTSWKPAEKAIAEKGGPPPMGETKTAPSESTDFHLPGSMSIAGHPGGSVTYTHTAKAATAAPHSLTYHNPLGKQEQDQPPEGPPKHPAVSGYNVGIVTAEYPYDKAPAATNKDLANELTQRGFKFEPAPGRYEGRDENSFIIHGPSVEDMEDLGRRYGQKSVIHSQGGTHKMIYTNGPRAGMYNPGRGVNVFDQQPEDFFTTINHGGQPVHFNYNFDWNTYAPMRFARTGFKHPHAYDWHEGHTRHNFEPKKGLRKTEIHIAPRGFIDPQGVFHQIDSGDTHHDWIHRAVAGYDEDGSYQNALSAGWLSVGIGAGDFSEGHNIQGTVAHLSNKKNPAVRTARKIANEHWGPNFEAMIHHPNGHLETNNFDTDVFIRHGVMKQSLGKAESNDQAAGVGVGTYAQFAAPYGTVTPGTHSNLMHYDYRPHEAALDKMIAQNGYKVFYAGGKYGKPDLAAKNYNTGHLQIYDPTPGSGGDSGEEAYTRSWRKAHELAHALTYKDLNAQYGEGRRIGKLGIHRTPHEAKRSLAWEYMAVHKQRELSAQLGHHIPDEVFHRELNTVMHDAVHRAVTGQFTEPSQEGFVPHSHKVPLETAFKAVDDHAQQMGLGDHDTVKSKALSPATPASV